MVHSEMITMCKELKQQREFFNACKKRLRSKRIVLHGRFVFTTEEMLQITKKVESINATKNVQKWPQKRPIQTILKNDKNDMPNSKSSSSDSNCIIVATRS